MSTLEERKAFVEMIKEAQRLEALKPKEEVEEVEADATGIIVLIFLGLMVIALYYICIGISSAYNYTSDKATQYYDTHAIVITNTTDVKGIDVVKASPVVDKVIVINHR